jgi:hypothetical protein
MRMIFINTILCLLIVVISIAFSSSSTIENDDNLDANLDSDDFGNYYPIHLFNTRAAKSRFWKRAPHRKFWKRSLHENDLAGQDKY